MIKAESRIAEEHARYRNYLNSTTEPKLRQLMDTEYISNHAKAMIETEGSGCVCMMRDAKFDDLRRMYNLLSRVPVNLELLRDSMGSYVKKCGEDILADQENVKDPVAFVQRMLDLKAKFDRIIVECFNSEKKAQKKLKEAFESFVNKDARSAAYLAAYVDDFFEKRHQGGVRN